MMKVPPPIDPSIAYVEGYYWVYNLKHGSVAVILHQDGRWHQRYEQGDGIGIVEGPLQLPTEEQKASQNAYFAAEVQKQREPYGYIEDASWFDWVDGYYWIQFPDDEPEIAFVMEDRWQSLSFINGDNEWASDFAAEGEEEEMPVIYGPIMAPKVERTLHS